MASEKTMNDYIIQDKEDRANSLGEPRDQHFIQNDDQDGAPGLLIPETERLKDIYKLQEREIQMAHAFNKGIGVLDERYSTQISPTNGKMIVRAYVVDPVNDDGVFVGFGSIFVPAKGNEYKSNEIPNPLPFQIRAVIVNVADGITDFSVGQEVQLNPSVIALRPVRGTESLMCDKMFERYDSSFDHNNPYEHFGYLMIRPGDIECKLNASE